MSPNLRYNSAVPPSGPSACDMSHYINAMVVQYGKHGEYGEYNKRVQEEEVS
jgi:hypothetical protein